MKHLLTSLNGTAKAAAASGLTVDDETDLQTVLVHVEGFGASGGWNKALKAAW